MEAGNHCALKDTKSEQLGSGEVARNPHLPAAAPAGLLSRRVTGEVTEAAAAGQNNTKKDPGFFPFGWLRASAGGSG